jgi:hypothetical protein
VSHILPKNSWAKPYIFYVDMNAGSGYNDEVDCPGSPLEFAAIAQKYLFAKEAFFIEQNADSFGSLTSHQELSVYNCCMADSCKILPDIIDQFGNKAFGLIYYDPNGITMNSKMSVFDSARAVCSKPEARFIDILIRFSGTNYKRSRGAFPGKYPPLKEQLSGIGKSRWICRKIAIDDLGHRDPNQWTFLLGTNWTDYKAWRQKGFYPIEDPDSDFELINNMADEVSEDVS